MFRRTTIVFIIGSLLLLGIACKHKGPSDPLAEVDSKQPDKVLFSRAMDATKHGKYEVARLNLQTLINTYPDSEYVARAKMAIGDAWLAEGGSAALTQAENEYKDFITFFPNMPEAAEAQLKIADIHFRQIQKPDRDYTHAKRAEEEYRQLLLQFPDSKLADTARIKLLEVQEILAEREFRIGHFYYSRESWPAAIARLKSMTDAYPLYSKADEALFLLGDAYERQAQQFRIQKFPSGKEDVRNTLIRQYNDMAAAAFSRIVTRYPAMPRASEAAKKLEALGRPVPKPTQEAIDLNRREIASRSKAGYTGRALLMIHKHPDFEPATKVGEPTLVDPEQANAAQIVRQANDMVLNPQPAQENSQVTADPISSASTENAPIPHSTEAQSADAPAPAPPQVNEVNASDPSQANNQNQANDQNQGDSSSKAAKKSGLRKLIPF